jgi:hypothetical protein
LASILFAFLYLNNQWWDWHPSNDSKSPNILFFYSQGQERQGRGPAREEDTQKEGRWRSQKTHECLFLVPAGQTRCNQTRKAWSWSQRSDSRK